MSPDTERTGTTDLERVADDITSLRHALHAHPEPSDEEAETAARVKDFLATHGLRPVAEKVGGHGLLYRIDDVVPDGKHLLLRADLDALPLTEKSDADHVSTRRGFHHACGHDGHAAMLAGALVALQAERGRGSGTVHALFQPAEETGQGGAQALRHPAVQKLDVAFAYAFHNIPGAPLGTALLRSGPMACASTGVHVHLEGATSHASEPQHGRNPIPALARLALQVEGLPQRIAPNDDAALATLIELRAGEVAYGTSAGAGGLRVTMRAADDERLDALVAALRERAEREAADGGFAVIVEEHERFPGTTNDEDAIARARRGLASAGVATQDIERPFPWSEDFGHLSGRWPGALIGLGAGRDHAPLHSPGYDFPDALLAIGMRAWLALVTGGDTP